MTLWSATQSCASCHPQLSRLHTSRRAKSGFRCWPADVLAIPNLHGNKLPKNDERPNRDKTETIRKIWHAPECPTIIDYWIDIYIFCFHSVVMSDMIWTVKPSLLKQTPASELATDLNICWFKSPLPGQIQMPLAGQIRLFTINSQRFQPNILMSSKVFWVKSGFLLVEYGWIPHVCFNLKHPSFVVNTFESIKTSPKVWPCVILVPKFGRSLSPDILIQLGTRSPLAGGGGPPLRRRSLLTSTSGHLLDIHVVHSWLWVKSLSYCSP